MDDLAYKTLEDYQRSKEQALAHPSQFWAEIAANFDWHRKWDTILEYDFHKPEVKWFLGGQLNITEN